MKVFTKDTNEEVIEIEAKDDETLDVQFTEEEVGALKKLLPVADKILAMLAKHEEAPVEDTEEKPIEDTHGDNPTEDEDEDKDVVNDSFGSIGATTPKKITNDALNEDAKQLEIEDAWNKRFGR